MPNFRYKAQDAEGKLQNGVLLASDEQDLHERLKQKNLMLLEAKDLTKTAHYKPLKAKALSEYARQIGTLMHAGIPLVRCLQMTAEDEAVTPYERKIYGDITKEVMQGVPLSVAMESMPGVFPPLMINMFRASESSGGLDDTAMRISEQYLKEDRLNSKIKSSLVYPKILMFIIVLVVGVIFGFVMPQFKSLFDTMESLPVATKIMLAISDFVKKKWYVIIIVAVVVYIAFYFLKKIPKVQYYFDKAQIHLPKIGKLFKVIYTARFARTLCSLYSSGISIIQCLEIASHTIGNTYIESQFKQVIADTLAGDPLSVSIGRVDGFVKKLESSVRVGEESGSLDTMLSSIADDMEFESERAIAQMTAYIEPVMIIIMAIIVGFIMISVIVPIYQSYSQIGKK
ncbi:MAG: type II secretion system F family protein [Lachnospiraceae bacterium]|nr:type II secretion system F family protein [Lachnospiraceae bacterium]